MTDVQRLGIMAPVDCREGCFKILNYSDYDIKIDCGG